MDNDSEGDIKTIGQEGIEPPVEVSLPDPPDLHASHCENLRRRYHPTKPVAMTDESSAWAHVLQSHPLRDGFLRHYHFYYKHDQ
jgi:hypothetical protein